MNKNRQFLGQLSSYHIMYIHTYIINKQTGLNVTAFVLMGTSIICSLHEIDG